MGATDETARKQGEPNAENETVSDIRETRSWGRARCPGGDADVHVNGSCRCISITL